MFLVERLASMYVYIALFLVNLFYFILFLVRA